MIDRLGLLNSFKIVFALHELVSTFVVQSEDIEFRTSVMTKASDPEYRY
jgi:hypothetical protein